MDGLSKRQSLLRLKAQIAQLENRAVLVGDQDLGASPLDQAGPCAPPGSLSEIFAGELRDGGASLGFALGQARALMTAERRAVFFMQLTHQAQELGLPYGAGLKSFGFDPEALILIRTASVTELLWAVEEAVACRAVAAVIAEIDGRPKALDFTASRRLSLRAASGGAAVLLLRYGAEREASAAQLRWGIAAAPSGERPFDARAPGQTRWQVRLEKGHLAGLGDKGWLLGWTDHGFAWVGDRAGDGGAGRVAAPLSGAAPAAVGHRLAETA